MHRRTLRSFTYGAAAIIIFLLGMTFGQSTVNVFAQEQEERTDVVVETENREQGILVASVVPDGPAAAAGITRGDILLQIDGQAVNQPFELTSQLQEMSAGDEVQITVLHGDEERVVPVTLADRNGQAYLGLVPCGPGMMGNAMIRQLQPGVRVTEVAPDSPAAQADLQPGDMIIAVDGQELNQENNLADLIGSHEPGDAVTLTVERAGEEEAREISVTLGENPDEAGRAYLGIRFQQFPQMGMFRGMPLPPGGQEFDQMPPGRDFFLFPGDTFEQGAIIGNVAEDSPAAAAGLSQGDVITSIDGEPVQGPRDVIDMVAAHQPDDTLTLTVTSPGEEESREVTVTLAENPNEAGRAYLGVGLGGPMRFFMPQAPQNENMPEDENDVTPENENDQGSAAEEEMRFFFDRLPLDEEIRSLINRLPFEFNFEALPFEEFEKAAPFEQFEFELPCDETGACSGNTI